MKLLEESAVEMESVAEEFLDGGHTGRAFEPLRLVYLLIPNAVYK